MTMPHVIRMQEIGHQLLFHFGVVPEICASRFAVAVVLVVQKFRPHLLS